MAYITDEELVGLRVTRMILHVVAADDEDFRPEPEIEVQQAEFFLSRVHQEASDGLFSFTPDSAVRPILAAMAAGGTGFEEGGRDLARLFKRLHGRQSSSGAFFVIELRCDVDDVVFYALVKYDYREAVELAQSDGQNVLRAIVQAFVKERRAVQKFCLVRTVAGECDDEVTATDRMGTSPDLTDYFQRYLGVRRSRSNAELSKRLNEAVRRSVEAVRDDLPGRDVGEGVRRAKAALQARDPVTNDDVVDAVMHAADRPSDESVRVRIGNAVRRNLRAGKLEDVSFKPDAASLRFQPRRTVRTQEEVLIEFPAEELGNSVRREEIEGDYVFTIRTKRLVSDGTKPDGAR
jgi:hypothetical protein